MAPSFTLLIIYHKNVVKTYIPIKNELEFTFIEIVNPKKSNILVGVIYRHPSMEFTDFNCNDLNNLLEDTSRQQQSIFLIGNFNVNLLHFNEHKDTVIDSI